MVYNRISGGEDCTFQAQHAQQTSQPQQHCSPEPWSPQPKSSQQPGFPQQERSQLPCSLVGNQTQSQHTKSPQITQKQSTHHSPLVFTNSLSLHLREQEHRQQL